MREQLTIYIYVVWIISSKFWFIDLFIFGRQLKILLPHL